MKVELLLFCEDCTSSLVVCLFWTCMQHHSGRQSYCTLGQTVICQQYQGFAKSLGEIIRSLESFVNVSDAGFEGVGWLSGEFDHWGMASVGQCMEREHWFGAQVGPRTFKLLLYLVWVVRSRGFYGYLPNPWPNCQLHVPVLGFTRKCLVGRNWAEQSLQPGIINPTCAQ